MKNLKHLLKYIPEVYFIVLLSWWAIYVYIDDHSLIHYPAISIVALLLIQLFINNRIIGYSISIILAIFSFYLILALISDLKNAVTFDIRALMFLIKGGLLIIGNLVIATLMFHKFLSSDGAEKSNTITG